MTNYYEKYIKYKTKYLTLKGGIKKISEKRKEKEQKKIRIELAKKGYSLYSRPGFKTVSKCYIKNAHYDKETCNRMKKTCKWDLRHKICYNKKDNIFYSCNVSILNGKNISMKFADGEKLETFKKRVKNIFKIEDDLFFDLYDIDDISKLTQEKLTKNLSNKTFVIIVEPQSE